MQTHPYSDMLFGIDADPQEAFDAVLRTAAHIEAISGRTIRICKRSESRLRHIMPKGAGGFTFPVPFYGVVILIDDKIWGTHAGRITLMHELCHTLQIIKYSTLLWAGLYLFAFPALLTLRAYFELEAFSVSVQETIRTYGSISDERLREMAKNFTSPMYFFMAISSEKYYKKLKVVADHEKQTFDGLVKLTDDVKSILSARGPAGAAEAVDADERQTSLANIEPLGRA